MIHGHAKRRGRPATKVYAVWASMTQRCTNPHARAFRWYGARGITVCRRWRRSFEAFLADMGLPRGRQLDRVDNHKGYAPSNCRWASRTQQARNRRGLKLNVKAVAEIRRRLRVGDQSQSAIARDFGVSHRVIGRIKDGLLWKT